MDTTECQNLPCEAILRRIEIIPFVSKYTHNQMDHVDVHSEQEKATNKRTKRTKRTKTTNNKKI